MKIAHVVTWLDDNLTFGGPARVALNQAEGLAALGNTVTIFAAGPRTQYLKLTSGVDLRVHKGTRLGKSFSSVISPGLLLDVITRRKMHEIWHLHLCRDLISMLVGRLLGLLGSDYFVQTHGMLVKTKSPKVLTYDFLLTRSVVSKSRNLFYLTSTELREIIDQFGVRGNEEQLENGVPIPKNTPAKDAHPTIIFLSRLHERKNPLLYLQAAKSHLESSDTTFLIGGQDEGEGPRILDWLYENRQLQIRHLGAVEAHDVEAKLGSCWALALPSVNEPFPMIALEAMSLGVPVIITNTCGLSEYVSFAKAGIVIEPDVAALTKAFDQIVQPKFNQEASRKALGLAIEKFSITGVSSRLESFYKNVQGPV